MAGTDPGQLTTALVRRIVGRLHLLLLHLLLAHLLLLHVDLLGSAQRASGWKAGAEGHGAGLRRLWRFVGVGIVVVAAGRVVCG